MTYFNHQDIISVGIEQGPGISAKSKGLEFFIVSKSL